MAIFWMKISRLSGLVGGLIAGLISLPAIGADMAEETGARGLAPVATADCIADCTPKGNPPFLTDAWARQNRPTTSSVARTKNVTLASAIVEKPALFTQCAACHSLAPNTHFFGPSLAGVSGRKAASLPDYSYSTALKNSGLTWDSDTLDIWLTNPRKAVPGTRMPFVGIADAEKRRAVVAFLLTLK